jgi:hypothetical protein
VSEHNGLHDAALDARQYSLGSMLSNSSCVAIHPVSTGMAMERWAEVDLHGLTERLRATAAPPGQEPASGHSDAGPIMVRRAGRFGSRMSNATTSLCGSEPGSRGRRAQAKKNLGNQPNRKYDSPCRSVRPRWPIDAGGFRHETRQAMGDPARGECPDPPRISRSESLPGRLLVLALAGLLVRGQPEQGCGARPKGQSRVHASMG